VAELCGGNAASAVVVAAASALVVWRYSGWRCAALAVLVAAARGSIIDSSAIAILNEFSGIANPDVHPNVRLLYTVPNLPSALAGLSGWPPADVPAQEP